MKIFCIRWFFILTIISTFSILPACVSATENSGRSKFFQGLWETSEKAGYSLDETTPGYKDHFPYHIGNILRIVLSFLGVIFLILIIYGGFTWMTAGGNEQQITKAKGIIFNAIIGLIVVLAAYAITAYFGEEIGKALIK